MIKAATPEATSLYSQKHSTIKFKNLGQTNFTVSPAGFGSYRVHISVNEHRKALEYALLNGINLIDTSSNYADGGSEELIGAVIKNLANENKVKREEIVIVSKVGYLQGQNFQFSQQLKQQGKPFPDLVEYGNGLEHCIHPDFITNQLTRSLQRLQMKTIDVYLLHNPEYWLLWAHKQGMDLVDARNEYYRRIEQAFMHLEIEAQNGRIQFYGISSNTFPIPSRHYDFTSAEKIWEIAQNISEQNKFKIIQMPLNLFEHGAITEKNLPNNQSTVQFAEKKKLAVLANRPLNAFSGNHMKRLVTLDTNTAFDRTGLQDKLSQITNLETDFVSKILPGLNANEETQKKLTGYFSSGTYLNMNWQKLGPYWQWIESQALFLTDQISYAVQLVNDLPDKDRKVVKWLDDYVELFNTVLGHITLFLGEKISKENKKLFEDLKKHNSFIKDTETLQQLAITALLNCNGISSTLIGMRREEYVRDVLEFLKQPKLNLDSEFWMKLK